MTEVENLTLSLLRRIDMRVDRLAEDMVEVKARIGNLEHQMASFEVKFATVEVRIASMSTRIDRIDHRLDRIERRLDLSDEPSIN